MELAHDGLRLAAVLRNLQHTHACAHTRVRTHMKHTHTHTCARAHTHEAHMWTGHHWPSYRRVVSVSMVSMTTTMTWQTAMRKMASCSDCSSTSISAESPVGRGASLWEYCSIRALLRMGWGGGRGMVRVHLLTDLAPPTPVRPIGLPSRWSPPCPLPPSGSPGSPGSLWTADGT